MPCPLPACSLLQICVHRQRCPGTHATGRGGPGTLRGLPALHGGKSQHNTTLNTRLTYHNTTRMYTGREEVNLVAYITATIRVIKFFGTDVPEDLLTTYRTWSSHYDRKRSAARRGMQTWQNLSQQSKWLHWKEVISVVREQREEYEAARTSIAEDFRYAVLLFYTCLPPGRSKEYRCIQFRLHPTVPTPTEPD